jgi:epoxyqueuosine reductase QueG
MKVSGMSVNQTNYTGLKKFCQAQGIDLFGVADISKIKDEFLLSQKILSKLDQAVCLGAVLSTGILEEIECTPTKLYFHHYRTLNAFLDQVALKVARYIQKKGYLALPIPASQILDWRNLKAHLSHKQIGYLAGLGWLGRNNLLVNNKFGSQFRLASILTDMPLKIDEPTKNDCGSCQLCVRICPAQAIKENLQDFDHIKCFEKLKEFQKQKLADQYICGVCIKVCKGKG